MSEETPVYLLAVIATPIIPLRCYDRLDGMEYVIFVYIADRVSQTSEGLIIPARTTDFVGTSALKALCQQSTRFTVSRILSQQKLHTQQTSWFGPSLSGSFNFSQKTAAHKAVPCRAHRMNAFVH